PRRRRRPPAVPTRTQLTRPARAPRARRPRRTAFRAVVPAVRSGRTRTRPTRRARALPARRRRTPASGRPSRNDRQPGRGREADSPAHSTSTAERGDFSDDSQLGVARLPRERSWLVSGAMERANGSGGGRILVVDDEDSIVDAVANALRYEGFDMREGTNGRNALVDVRQVEPDRIVIERIITELDGMRVVS